MKITVLLQNGRPYQAFTNLNHAGDEMTRLIKTYPWFTWGIVTMSVNQTQARIRSEA